jgi:hypothetical protein
LELGVFPLAGRRRGWVVSIHEYKDTTGVNR